MKQQTLNMVGNVWQRARYGCLAVVIIATMGLSLVVPAGQAWASQAEGQAMLQRVASAEQAARGSLMPMPQAEAGAVAKLGSDGWQFSGGNITGVLQRALDDGNVRVIELPVGTFTIGAISLNTAKNKVVRGNGSLTTLVFDASQPQPPFMNTSGGRAEKLLFTEFTLDARWQPGRKTQNAFQLTNARDIQFYKMAIKNVAQSAILAQGLGAGGGTPNLLVLDTVVENAGLADQTTGFGVLVKDNSPHAKVVGSRVVGVKGGMGVGAHATKVGAPVNMTIISNHISMVRSATAFEGIGLTKGAHNAVVARNVIEPSFDNGISLSSNNNLAVQNFVSSAWNHGCSLEGEGNMLVANEVTAVGHQNYALGEHNDYAGVAIENGTRNTVSGNKITGGDMVYAVKFNQAQRGSNKIGHNQFAWNKAEFNKKPLASDVIGDSAPDYHIALLNADQRAAIASNAGPTQVATPGTPDSTYKPDEKKKEDTKKKDDKKKSRSHDDNGVAPQQHQQQSQDQGAFDPSRLIWLAVGIIVLIIAGGSLIALFIYYRMRKRQ